MDDILFDSLEFILETPTGSPGGVIESFSMDGVSYDYLTTSSSEFSYVFV